MTRLMPNLSSIGRQITNAPGEEFISLIVRICVTVMDVKEKSMDVYERMIKQTRDLLAIIGNKRYVYLEKGQERPQTYFIEVGMGCTQCTRRSCVEPDRCIYAMLMALKKVQTISPEVPWFEIRATRGDRIYIEDRRVLN